MVALQQTKLGIQAGDLLQDPAFVPLRGVELALMRAKPALEDGWRLTAEEAMSFTGLNSRPTRLSREDSESCGELEDEVDEVALSFSEQQD
jgi:hypothetical protein